MLKRFGLELERGRIGLARRRTPSDKLQAVVVLVAHVRQNELGRQVSPKVNLAAQLRIE